MPKNKNTKSFEIAISGISCAIAVIFLSLGILSGWLLATGYFIGIIALMIPLSKQCYLGGFLAYLGTCILTLIMGAAAGFWNLVPFIMFFGLHPLINALQVKHNFNRWIALVLKAVWFDCTLIAGYFLVYGGLMGGNLFPQNVYDTINKYLYLIIFTAGTAAFVLYDFLVFKVQAAINVIAAKIKK